MFKWTSKYAIPGGVIGSSVWGEIITAGETLHRDASERDFLGWFIVDIFKIFGRKAQRRWSIKNQWCIYIISTTSTLFQPNNANITAAGGSSSVCQSALAFKKWRQNNLLIRKMVGDTCASQVSYLLFYNMSHPMFRLHVYVLTFMLRRRGSCKF